MRWPSCDVLLTPWWYAETGGMGRSDGRVALKGKRGYTMTPQVHVNETIQTGDGKPVETPAPPAAVPQAVTPEWVQTATPPTPPRYPPVAPPRRGPSAGRWALAIGLVLVGGLSWFIFGWGIAFAGSNVALGIAIGAIPALTCLAAGWLLASWARAVVPVIVYLAVSAVMWMLAIVGVGDVQAWAVGFPLSVVLPAVVLGAIGTAIGMAIAGRRR